MADGTTSRAPRTMGAGAAIIEKLTLQAYLQWCSGTFF
jgi:hypothetical protein